MKSVLQQLLEEAQNEKSPQERGYGRFPIEIAERCGRAEVKEILQRLDTLGSDKASLPAWDTDSQDEIWRVQKGFSEVLERLTAKYIDELVLGFESEVNETAFWVAHAILNAPNDKAIEPLVSYLERDIPELNRKVASEALAACQNL